MCKSKCIHYRLLRWTLLTNVSDASLSKCLFFFTLLTLFYVYRFFIGLPLHYSELLCTIVNITYFILPNFNLIAPWVRDKILIPLFWIKTDFVFDFPQHCVWLFVGRGASDRGALHHHEQPVLQALLPAWVGRRAVGLSHDLLLLHPPHAQDQGGGGSVQLGEPPSP